MRIKLQVMLVMMVLSLLNGWYCLGCWEEERVALLHLEANMIFPNGRSWLLWQMVDNIGTDCCQWKMVECSNATKRVISLNLDYARDWKLGDWYFNASLFLPFQELRNLSLFGNRLVGWIENEGFDKLSKLRNLEALDLGGNSFDRKILSSLSHLSSLKHLRIGYNRLERENDSNGRERLFGLTKLEVLDLSYNDWFSDGDPLSLLNLNDFINLKELDLSGIKLRSLGTIYELRHLRWLEGLFLDDSNVDGNFLQRIGALTSLKILSLSRCRLNGTLPIQGLCELKNLQELDLSENEHEGILPSCVANMTSLRFVDLSLNTFTGNIAFSPLSKLTSLEYLSISSNNFQVPISFKAFFNHSNLKFLFLENNEIINDNELGNLVPNFQLEVFSMPNSRGHPSLPNFLYYQSNLGILHLPNNSIGGNFPSWLLENNTRLRGIYLRDNAFTGPLKLPTSTNPNMETFDVSNNEFSGHVPTNISSIFPNLISLNMATNMFDGCLPYSFGGLKSIEHIDLSNNNLSGTIPHELVMGCFSLAFLILSDNKLQGQIFLKSLSTIPLKVLDVSNNRLSGRFPTSVGNMTTLFQISLSYNQLEGPIPEEICNLDNLFILDLSENKLRGSIPSCFNPSQISQVYLNNNQLEGELTCAFSNSSSLVLLDLRWNKFIGSIPQWIGNLSSLSIILLGHNHFEGTIPHQFCEMSLPSMIDLSFNFLSGQIPHCFGNVTREVIGDPFGPLSAMISQTFRSYMVKLELERAYHVFSNGIDDSILPLEPITATFTTKRNSYSYKGRILNYMSGIDLSSNLLHGEIPNGLGNISEIRALNLSHNYLIGTIPETFSNLRQIESLDLSYNNLGGRIPAGLSKLDALGFFSVAHNNLTGMIPEKGHLGTFDEGSYQGNPYLCGRPLPDCASTGSIPVLPSTDDESEELGFMDMEFFYITFIISYLSVVLCIATVLSINPHWRKAWFHFIEVNIIRFLGRVFWTIFPFSESRFDNSEVTK